MDLALNNLIKRFPPSERKLVLSLQQYSCFLLSALFFVIMWLFDNFGVRKVPAEMLKQVGKKKKKPTQIVFPPTLEHGAGGRELIFRLGVNTTPRDTDCGFIAGLSYEFVDITTARRRGYSSTCFSVCCFYLPSGLWSVTTSTAWRLLRSHCMRCETAAMRFFPPPRCKRGSRGVRPPLSAADRVSASGPM